MSMKAAEIDIAHRLPSRNSSLPPPLIVKLLNRWKKEKLMSAAKIKMPTAAQFGGSSTTRIYVNEHLAPKTQQIFAYARRKLKEEYFVWARGGLVTCRRRVDGAQPIPISHLDDVDFISETKEDNMNGALFKQGGKRHRGSSGDEGSPVGGLRQFKKALRSSATSHSGSQVTMES